MICSLCLKEIKEDEDYEVVNDYYKHSSCSKIFNALILELEEIYNEDLNNISKNS